jgi:hypothetical protein
VQVVAEIGVAGVAIDHPRREVSRVGGHEAQPAQARQRRDRVQQIGEVSLPAGLAPVVDGLAEQLDLDEAVVEQVRDLGHDLGERAAALGAAGRRHDAEGAPLVAALDDRDHALEGALARDGVEVVLPLGGEAGRHHPLAGLDPRHQGRELTDPRRAEDEVEAARAGQRALALLLRHAAAETDAQRGPLGLEQAVLAQAGVGLLRRLLAHAARVEQDDVGLARVARRQDPLAHQLAGHALAVQLVHLTAPGLEEVPPGGGRGARAHGAAGGSSS